MSAYSSTYIQTHPYILSQAHTLLYKYFIYMLIKTHTYTVLHTCAHIHIHTHFTGSLSITETLHTYMPLYTFTQPCTLSYTYTYMHIITITNTCTHSNTYIVINTHANEHIHTGTHVYLHAYSFPVLCSPFYPTTHKPSFSFLIFYVYCMSSLFAKRRLTLWRGGIFLFHSPISPEIKCLGEREH